MTDEVTSAAKKWPDTTHQAGRKFTFAYDNIGNRISASRGGDGNGANLRTTNCSAAGGSAASTNDKNQYVTIKNHRYYDIVGTDSDPGSVGVSVSGATVTNGDQSGFNYFRREVSHTGTTTGHFDTVNVTPSGTGKHHLPEATETVAHDDDGNRTADSRWEYTWDANNRLASATTRSGSGIDPASDDSVKLVFAYDYLGRRIQKQIFVPSDDGSPTATVKFIWDGWNCVGSKTTVDTTTTTQTYIWGPDLSGTLQGAGRDLFD